MKKQGWAIWVLMFAVFIWTAGSLFAWEAKTSPDLPEPTNSVEKTFNGGYIAVGFNHLSTGGIDVQVINTDKEGKSLWQTGFHLNWTTNRDDIAYDPFSGEEASVQQTIDGNFIVAIRALFATDTDTGRKVTKCLLTNLGQGDGKILWQTTLSSWQIPPNPVVIDSDGNSVVGWLFPINDGTNPYLCKKDSKGKFFHERTFGGTNANSGYSVRQTSDGGRIAFNWTTRSTEGRCNFYSIKFDGTAVSPNFWTLYR